MRPSATLQNKCRTLNHLWSHSGGSWTLDSPCILLAWGSNWQSPICAHSQWRMTFTDLHDLPLSAYHSRIFSCCSSYYCSPSSKAEEHTASIYIIYTLLYTDWLNKCQRNDFLCVAGPLSILLSPSCRSSFQSSLEASPPPGSLPGVAPPALPTYHHTCNTGWRLFSGLSLSGLWALG